MLASKSSLCPMKGNRIVMIIIVHECIFIREIIAYRQIFDLASWISRCFVRDSLSFTFEKIDFRKVGMTTPTNIRIGVRFFPTSKRRVSSRVTSNGTYIYCNKRKFKTKFYPLLLVKAPRLWRLFVIKIN